MKIKFWGNECFEINFKEAVLFTSPPLEKWQEFSRSEEVVFSFGLKTYPEMEFSYPDSVVVVNGPGDYEMKNILIRGIEIARSKQEDKIVVTTAYCFQGDEISLVHLDHLNDNLTAKQLEILGDVDILLINVNMDKVSPADIIKQLEPEIVIPMGYAKEDKDWEKQVEDFCKEIGVEEPEVVEEIKVSQGDLKEDENIRVLKPL